MTVVEIYTGSDGEATKALYSALEQLGPDGLVAMNLFRAQKCSERAKKYRGRRYVNDAYARKEWSLGLLCDILAAHGEALGIAWGWKVDPKEPFAKWVLYVETSQGQISFHSPKRLNGPDFNGDWDRAPGVCPMRVVTLTRETLSKHGIENIQYAKRS